MIKGGTNNNFMFCTHFLHFFTFVIKLFSYNHYGFALLLISFPEISSTFLILPTPWPTFLLQLHFTSLSTPILLSYIPSTISSFFFFSSCILVSCNLGSSLILFLFLHISLFFYLPFSPSLTLSIYLSVSVIIFLTLSFTLHLSLSAITSLTIYFRRHGSDSP